MSNKLGKIKALIEGLKSRNESKVSGTQIVYDMIIDELNQYEEELHEITNLKETTGHTHFRVKEVSDKILKLIDEDESVLRIQDKKSGKNIGMKATDLELFDISKRALEDKIASTQQDEDGYNLAMLSLSYSNKELVLAAMNDPLVLVQKTFYDHTLKDILMDRPDSYFYGDEEILQKIKEIEESPEYITALNLENQDDEIIDLNKYVYDLGIGGENENENF